jgi:hypothetical protein
MNSTFFLALNELIEQARRVIIIWGHRWGHPF